MRDQLNRIESSVEKIRDDVAEMRVVQAEHALDIKHHIKRTDLLESKLSLYKLILGVGAVCGAIYAVIHLIQTLHP